MAVPASSRASPLPQWLGEYTWLVYTRNPVGAGLPAMNDDAVY